MPLYQTNSLTRIPWSTSPLPIRLFPGTSSQRHIQRGWREELGKRWDVRVRPRSNLYNGERKSHGVAT